MPNGVACSVSNCSFWEENNRCSAEAIQIEIDEHSNLNLSAEFADEGFGLNHKDSAQKSAETCCLTFNPKG